jgi:hypothetical protein
MKTLLLLSVINENFAITNDSLIKWKQPFRAVCVFVDGTDRIAVDCVKIFI